MSNMESNSGAESHFDLQRFVAAQESVYETVLAELRSGRKESHWMWFIFPQLRGLGRSRMSVEYGIEGIDEARSYLRHAVLGGRLYECTRLVSEVEGRSIREIFGYPDYLKFRSSMTLFREAADDATIFQTALKKFFGGEEDSGTLALLGAARH